MKSGNHTRGPTSGLTIWGVIAIVAIIVVVLLVILPPWCTTRPRSASKAGCQNNMKELGTAINMYHGDYNGMLPSSYLYDRKKAWNRADFIAFTSKAGTLPPPEHVGTGATLAMLLYDYIKNKDILWCPSDPDGRDNGNISYFYKAAVDRAWYGDGKVSAKKEGDFDFPADQVVLYEKSGWHWGDTDKGLANGVTLNMTFLDGHVQTKRIANSGGSAVTPAPAVGEPAWFNYSSGEDKPRLATGAYWNPKVWSDSLP